MTKRIGLAVAGAIVAGLSLAFVVNAKVVGTPSDPVGSEQAPIKPGAVAQMVYGNVCSTPVGLCLVPPQPVNSTCSCGSVVGVIVP